MNKTETFDWDIYGGENGHMLKTGYIPFIRIPHTLLCFILKFPLAKAVLFDRFQKWDNFIYVATTPVIY
jgi:hypothetical protein